MSLSAIGTVLVVLVIIFIVSHGWFYIVEGLLSGFKRLFAKKEPTAWHMLPTEQEKEDEDG